MATVNSQILPVFLISATYDYGKESTHTLENNKIYVKFLGFAVIWWAITMLRTIWICQILYYTLFQNLGRVHKRYKQKNGGQYFFWLKGKNIIKWAVIEKGKRNKSNLPVIVTKKILSLILPMLSLLLMCHNDFSVFNIHNSDIC